MIYSILFLCYFCNRSLYCFNQSLDCFLREKVLREKVGGSEKSRLLGGCEKNRLLNGVEKWSHRQRYRRCSKWPSSARTQASSLVRHWSMTMWWMTSSTTLCWNSRVTPCLSQPLSQCDHVADWSLVHSLLHHAHAVVHRVQIMAVGWPHVRNDELVSRGAVVRPSDALWLMWSKSDFFISLGSAVTFFRWSWQIYSRLVSSFVGSPCSKK